MEIRELKPDELRCVCDPGEFDFQSTAELPELTEIIGQVRATRAIDFGVDIPCYGYNIFIIGPTGSGKTTTICCGRMSWRRWKRADFISIP